MSDIGKKIRLRREDLNMSQEDLAKKLGYKSKSTINKIEMGINDISQKKILAFADALNTTPAYLMGWSEENAFEKYIESLGYEIIKDDPEHKPFILWNKEAILLEYNTLQDLQKKIDKYSNVEIQAELISLKQKQYEKDMELRQHFIQKHNSYLEVNAAHERTDIQVTDEMIQHDNDIMDNF